MRTKFTTAILAAAIGWGAIPAFGQAKAPAPHAAEQQSVPVKEVVLYTSGVGYFEHFGTVKGNGVTELHFKTGQINDILKSLLLEDLDHGKVASVTYGSQEPLSHTLKSFQVDLSSAPSMADLLSQLRGAKVTATLTQGVVSGEVLSVEKKKKPQASGPAVDVTMLNLLLSGGSIRSVDMEQVTEIKLDDPKLQQELVKALSAVSAARDQDSKPVAIRFNGEGERRVRIGYVVEAPVWKASYRLVLTESAHNETPPPEAKLIDPLTGKEAAPKPADAKLVEPKVGEAHPEGLAGGKLQGWAIVENQTDSDWENVQLSLVSGRPISFMEDLYQPLYVTRPIVEPELYASLRPQRYTGGMNAVNDMAAADAKGERAYRKGFNGAPAALAGAAPMPDRAARQLRGRMVEEQLAKRDEADKDQIDATKSVQALASGASVGEFFQYTVGDVSLPRQKSAMIPIITDAITATRLSIYNAGVMADHPLLGARIVNSTGKLLPQGPITVLDAGAYAGDASINDLPTGQNRLLSYGIDQSTLIHANDQTDNSSLVTGKVVKGVLQLTYKQIFRQKYVAQNKGKTDRTLLIEHPKRIGWHLTQPQKPVETTDTLYRFEKDIPAGKTVSTTVEEEIINRQDMMILSMDPSQIDIYLRTGEIPATVKQALQKAAQLKMAVADTQRQIQEHQQQINEIGQEQSRIRDNMKAVAASTDYSKRLLAELDSQETQIQKLKADVKELRAKAEQQRKALEDYLQALSVE